MATKTAPLEWGMQPPNGIKTAWGARAIFDMPNRIDLVSDRQSQRGSQENLRPLLDWINRIGIGLLQDRLRTARIQSDDSKGIHIVHDDYTIEANPRASFGYLYIVAYPVG